jgi:hypothetical protein
MIIKRWNAGTTAWVEHYPKTVATQLFDTAGTTAVFDSNNKIKPAYLPDSVFDSLYFYTTATSSTTLLQTGANAYGNALVLNRSVIGFYAVASEAMDITRNFTATLTTFTTLVANITQGNTTITLTAASTTNGLAPGMVLVGNVLIPAGTTITSITNATQFVISNAPTGNQSSGVISFNAYFRSAIKYGEELNTYVRTFTLTSGSTTVTGGDTNNLFAGMRVAGAGMPGGSTTIASITDLTSFVLAAAATAPGSQSLTFTNNTEFSSVAKLEPGDWFIITEFYGTGTLGNPFTSVWSIVNNTYEIMKAATSTTSGAPGIVPAPVAGQQAHFLRGDGTWVIPTNTTYGIATTSTAGLVELAHDKITTALTIQTAGTTTNRYYGVRLNNADQMIVNVPWENTTYSEATTAALGLVQITHAKQTSAKTVQSETVVDGRFYGITLNNNGRAIVNVPWENTTYAKATTTSLGLVETAHDDLTSNPSITATTTDGRYYGVRLNEAQQMVVNVPWENTQYTAGVGLGLSSGEFSLTQPHVVSAAEPATTFRKDNTLWFDI